MTTVNEEGKALVEQSTFDKSKALADFMEYIHTYLTDDAIWRPNVSVLASILFGGLYILYLYMSMRLLEADHTGYGDSCFAETERLSGELRQEIDAFLQNQTWQDDIYFMRYVEMRREQCRVLQVIYRQLLRLNQVPEQAKPLSAFLADIAMHFHEGNDCSALLEQLESLYAAYQGHGIHYGVGEA